MSRYHVNLPAPQMPANAMLDTSGLNKAIDAIHKRNENAMARDERAEARKYEREQNAMAFGYKQQRDTIADQHRDKVFSADQEHRARTHSLQLDQQRVASEQHGWKAEDRKKDLDRQRATAAAGIFQNYIDSDPDPAGRSAKTQKFVNARPDLAGFLQQHGVNVEDPDSVRDFVYAQAREFQDPLDRDHKQAQTEKLRREAAGAGKEPASVQEYRFDMQQRQAAGEPILPYGEWSKERKSPLVSIGGENEYLKTRGKTLAENYEAMQTQGREATERISQLRQIDTLLSDPSVYTGTGAPSILALKRAGKTLLGLDFEGVGEAEAARRVSTEMALSLRTNLPGPLSNADREFLMNIPPNIGDSAAGRKLLVELMTAREQRRMEVAQLARQYRQMHGRLDEGWEDVLAQFSEDNPMFSSEMIERAQTAARATPQPSPAAGTGTPIASDTEYDALPSGSLYRGPDGVPRRKP